MREQSRILRVHYANAGMETFEHPHAQITHTRAHTRAHTRITLTSNPVNHPRTHPDLVVDILGLRREDLSTILFKVSVALAAFSLILLQGLMIVVQHVCQRDLLCACVRVCVCVRVRACVRAGVAQSDIRTNIWFAALHTYASAHVWVHDFVGGGSEGSLSARVCAMELDTDLKIIHAEVHLAEQELEANDAKAEDDFGDYVEQDVNDIDDNVIENAEVLQQPKDGIPCCAHIEDEASAVCVKFHRPDLWPASTPHLSTQ